MLEVFCTLVPACRYSLVFNLCYYTKGAPAWRFLRHMRREYVTDQTPPAVSVLQLHGLHFECGCMKSFLICSDIGEFLALKCGSWRLEQLYMLRNGHPQRCAMDMDEGVC